MATCGTALTEQHLKLLKRYTDNVYLLFDGDQAGQTATVRALNLAYQYDIFPKKIQLPVTAKDADDLANLPDGKDQFAQCFDRAQDAFMATFDQLKTVYDINSPIEKQKILNILFGLIQNINNISLQQHYLQSISDLMMIPFEILRTQYIKHTKTDGKITSSQRKPE